MNRLRFTGIFCVFFLLNAVSSAQEDQKIIDSLKAVLEKSEADTQVVDALNGLASMYRNSDPKLVEQYSGMALEMADSIGYNRGKVRSHTNLGNLAYISGNYPNTLDHYLKALTILEDIKDSSGIAGILMGIGNVYSAEKDLEKALEYQIKSLEIRKILKDSIGQAWNYNNIGGIYVDKQEWMPALENYMLSLKIKEKVGDWKGMSSGYGNIGVIYAKLGNLKFALDYQNKALEIRKKLNNKKGMVLSFNDIGDIHFRQKNIALAESNFKDAVALAKEIQFSEGLRNAYQNLTVLYQSKGDYKNAFRFQSRLKMVEDSLFTIEKATKIAQLEEEFTSVKKQAEIDLLQRDSEISRLQIENQDKQLEKKTYFILWLLFSGIAALGVAFFFYYRFRLKHRSNKVLAHQNNKIKNQKRQIEDKNRQITDSIKYAQLIQQSFIPNEQMMSKTLQNHFVIYEQKDLVSGDFYWVYEDKNRKLIAIADCTGHGVPGALMSMMAIASLNDIIKHNPLISSASILSELCHKIQHSFTSENNHLIQENGMDIGLVAFDKKTNKLEYCGAKNSAVYVKSSGEIVPLRGDNVSINSNGEMLYHVFSSRVVEATKGDRLYLFTDGLVDQFGGANGKKFKLTQLNLLLSQTHAMPILEQKRSLHSSFKEWRKNHEQLDDITFIGWEIL